MPAPAQLGPTARAESAHGPGRQRMPRVRIGRLSPGRLRLERPIWIVASFFIEIFAGGARMTTAARDCSAFGPELVMEPWDIIYGARYNLLVPANARKLFRIIESGLVRLAWWGTPCDIFSYARKWDGGPPAPARLRWQCRRRCPVGDLAR